MNGILPAVSDCSPKSVRDIGYTSLDEVACWLVELSGLLLTHSDFLASASDKSSWGSTGTDDSGAGEWPIENVFIGKKEPDLATALIAENVFIPQKSKSPASDVHVHYYTANMAKFTASNPVVAGEITAADTPECLDVSGGTGGKVKWFITPVENSNALLLVVEGYKRKATECTKTVTAADPEPLTERTRDECLQDSLKYVSRSRSWQRQRKSADYFCRRCRPGTYSTQPAMPCKLCLKGTFSSIVGAGACKLCQAGTYAVSTGLSLCTECSRGMYSLEIGAQNFTCLKDKECPEGADCQFSDGLREINLLPKEGYWHPSADAERFIDCSLAYVGVSAKKYGKERCCRHKTDTEIEQTTASQKAIEKSASKNKDDLINDMEEIVQTICDTPLKLSNKTADSQCSKGYRGNLCSSCAEGYVFRKGHCSVCEGGSDFGLAMVGLIIMSSTVYLIVIALMLPCSLKRLFHSGTGDGASLFGQIKIMMTFMQLTATMTTTFNSVPWSPRFTELCWAFNIANLDFAGFLMEGSCTMSVPALQKFFVTLLSPAVVMLAIAGALGTMKVALKSKIMTADELDSHSSDYDVDDSADAKLEGWELDAVAIKMLIFTTLLQYPAQSSGVFAMLRCRQLVGLGGEDAVWLQVDREMQCWTPDHMPYVAVALAGLALYVFGAPFLLLHQVKKILARIHRGDVGHKQQTILNFQYGAVYKQFEPEYWYFQFIIMGVKMLMTGMLALVAPGTPIQMLCAFFVMGALFSLLLKFAPYHNDVDDVVAISSKFGLCFTVLIGLLLLVEARLEKPFFDRVVMGDVLIASTLVVLLINIFGMVRVITLNAKKVAKDQSMKEGKTSVTPAPPVENLKELTLGGEGDSKKEDEAARPERSRSQRLRQDTVRGGIRHI